ncbi:MAG: hypothetical protein OEZ43_12475 [Gammaproteobacteria bacterium]|nr:hypothetical protein [Gammaproteobacteria bacterium]
MATRTGRGLSRLLPDTQGKVSDYVATLCVGASYSMLCLTSRIALTMGTVIIMSNIVIDGFLAVS